MSDPIDSHPSRQRVGFDSIGSRVLEFDGPGDATVRPCRPELLPAVLAERKLWEEAGLLPPLPRSEGEKEPPSDKEGAA